ncbi:MAG: hypothetical protein LUI60_08010 [Clostridia bacterium]|nr:hypothetical protein [Clostridia bacterium]
MEETEIINLFKFTDNGVNSSGNIYDENRKPKNCFYSTENSIIMGFTDNYLIKGDYIQLKLKSKVYKDKNYRYGFCCKTKYIQDAVAGLCYEVLLDNKVIYRLSTKSYYRANLVNILFKAWDNAENEILIRLVAEKDFSGAKHNGYLEVNNIELNQEYSCNYDYDIKVTDSLSSKKDTAEVNLQSCITSVKFVGGGIDSLAVPVASESDINHVADLRAKLVNSYDKSMLEDNGINLDVDNITELPEGRFSVTYKNVTFDCLFHLKKDKPLYVVLNGSKTGEPPEFKRWSWYPVFEGSMLNIADPTYKINDKIYLGWYYGNDEVNYRLLLVEVVKKITDFLGLDNSKVYFYGSSGGGAAALNCAGLLEGSTAITINPQIFLDKYHYAKEFKKLTGIDLSLRDKWHREDSSYWIANSPKSKFILVENINSEDDSVQFFALEKTLNKKFSYGISKFGNLGVWLYSAKVYNTPTHNAQEDQIIYFAIKCLIENMDNPSWDNLKSLYLIITELWREKWALRDEIKLLRNSNLQQ